MPVRKRKQVEAFDGSYAGNVLGAFDRMEAGDCPASELPLTADQRKQLSAVAADFRRRMQKICDRHGSPISISTREKTLAEFKPRKPIKGER